MWMRKRKGSKTEQRARHKPDRMSLSAAAAEELLSLGHIFGSDVSAASLPWGRQAFDVRLRPPDAAHGVSAAAFAVLRVAPPPSYPERE